MTRLALAWRLANGAGARALAFGMTVCLAFLLLGVASAIDTGMRGGIHSGDDARLVVTHRHSLSKSLPLSYQGELARLPQVDAVAPRQWFGGWYREPQFSFTQYIVDPRSELAAHPGFALPASERAAFLDGGNGVLVGRRLAQRFGWRTGDVVVVNSPLWPHRGGDERWEFRIAGVFDVDLSGGGGADAEAMLIDRRYFGAELPYARNLVGWYLVKIAASADAEQVAAAIDAGFAVKADPTRSVSERTFSNRMTHQLGDIGRFGAAVSLLVMGTFGLAMLLHFIQNRHAQRTDFAILSALGFERWRLCLYMAAGASLLCVGAAVTGIGLAALLLPLIREQLASLVPAVALPLSTFARGAALALALALAATLMAAARLPGVEQLDGERGAV
ncbi:ABC transporter permease [Massilia sp. DWR3-1-1]|uniref:ABC transporter permease n=1 Tax=Massilia sp. DWR3-1-1 TaxID=2804559 RepID=UPI003CE8B78D